MEIVHAKKCVEMAYGKGPFESVAYYLRLPASSASRLGHDPNEWFPVTYQMLNVQMASHLYLLNYNVEEKLSVKPEVLHVGTAN